jgi:endonuclease-3 related protein
MNDRELVYKITAFIPEGEVYTYGGLAKLTGIKNPRTVGQILHENKDFESVPCHRVVNSSGEVAKNYAFGGWKAQLEKLKRENVVTVANKVKLNGYLWRPSRCLSLYFDLLKKYGEPGPWPWFGQGKPHTSEEIAIGAVLTQNTNWKNVEKAIGNLKGEKVCTIKGIYQLESNSFTRRRLVKLKELIRPSGFYNQKATRLFEFCKFVVEDYGDLLSFFKLFIQEAREKLLAINGIGKETADTILLYADHKPVFVVDAYTKKFAKAYDLTKETDYDYLQSFFTKNLPVSVKLYQDYHALIVRWGKEN